MLQAAQQKADVGKVEAQLRAAASTSQPGVVPGGIAGLRAVGDMVGVAGFALAQLDVSRLVLAMAAWPVLLLQARSTARLRLGRSELCRSKLASACLAWVDPAPPVSWVLQVLWVPAKALLWGCRSVTAKAAGLAFPAGVCRVAPSDLVPCHSGCRLILQRHRLLRDDWCIRSRAKQARRSFFRGLARGGRGIAVSGIPTGRRLLFTHHRCAHRRSSPMLTPARSLISGGNDDERFQIPNHDRYR